MSSLDSSDLVSCVVQSDLSDDCSGQGAIVTKLPDAKPLKLVVFPLGQTNPK